MPTVAILNLLPYSHLDHFAPGHHFGLRTAQGVETCDSVAYCSRSSLSAEPFAGRAWRWPRRTPTPSRKCWLWKERTAGTNLALHRPVTFSPTPSYHLTIKGGTDATDWWTDTCAPTMARPSGATNEPSAGTAAKTAGTRSSWTSANRRSSPRWSGESRPVAERRTSLGRNGYGSPDHWTGRRSTTCAIAIVGRTMWPQPAHITSPTSALPKAATWSTSIRWSSTPRTSARGTWSSSSRWTGSGWPRTSWR